VKRADENELAIIAPFLEGIPLHGARAALKCCVLTSADSFMSTQIATVSENLRTTDRRPPFSGQSSVASAGPWSGDRGKYEPKSAKRLAGEIPTIF
jgi:hypothetical protein